MHRSHEWKAFWWFTRFSPSCAYNHENEPRMKAHQSHQISRRPSLTYACDIADFLWKKYHFTARRLLSLPMEEKISVHMRVELCEWESATDASIACIWISEEQNAHNFFFEAVKANWIWEKESPRGSIDEMNNCTQGAFSHVPEKKNSPQIDRSNFLLAMCCNLFVRYFVWADCDP